MKKSILKNISSLILLLSLGSVSAQSTWHLDGDKKAEVMPITYNTAAVEAGKASYLKNCKSCHGDPGANNSLPLVPKPTDLALAAFHQTNTDGEMFYKITDGKGAMPAFKAQIPETDRWNLVCFIRSFDKEYKGASAAAANVPGFKGKISDFIISYDTATKMIVVQLKAADSTGAKISPARVGVDISVKRQFGYLKLSDSPIKSNASGIAQIAIPENLPADSAGKLWVKVQLPDGSPNGSLSIEAQLNVYKPFIYDNPLNHRAMWGNRANTPLWLLFTYLGITIGVWLGIAWVALQLLKIVKLSKS